MPDMDAQEVLTRPVGPLPVWGWALVGGGGLFLYKHFKSGGTAIGKAVASGTDNSAAANTQEQVVGTNESWAQDAISYLEGQGYTASQAQSAISSYINGASLDPSMATLVDSASQGVGSPPQLVIPTSSVPTMPTASTPGATSTTTSGGATTVMPASSAYVKAHQAQYAALGATPKANGPKDPSGHTSYFSYTVKKGDTLSSVGSKFGSGAPQLKAWNNLKSNNLKVGSTIWV